MPEPKLLRIMKRLTALLEGITPENGYEFNMAGKVYRGVSVIPVDEAEGSLSILEMPRQEITIELPSGNGMIRNDQWQIMLQGWPTDDPRNPSDPAYRLKAECELRLSRIVAELPDGRGPAFPDDYMLGRELTSFAFTPGVVRPPEDASSRLAMFYMPLVLGVKVDMTNPY